MCVDVGVDIVVDVVVDEDVDVGVSVRVIIVVRSALFCASGAQVALPVQ